MARVESLHAQARFTARDGTVLDLAFPVAIGDGEGQITLHHAEELIAIDPQGYQIIPDPPPPAEPSPNDRPDPPPPAERRRRAKKDEEPHDDDPA